MRQFLLPVLMTTTLAAAETATPPVAKKVPKIIEAHGDKRVDNYFWLRDDKRKDPEVIAYLEAENKYTEAVMKPTEGLQKKLYDEILGRIKQTDESVPARKGNYWYYSRTIEGKQYPVSCRKKGSLEAPEEVMLDQNAMAEGTKYFRVANASVSPNEKILAFATDTSGDEVYTLQFKDLATGATLADKVPGTYYSVAWAADNKTIFYTTVDEAKRPYKIFRHTLGSDPKTDALVLHEPDERFYVQVRKSKDDEFIFIEIGSQTTSEARYLSASAPTTAPKTLYPRVQDIEYDVQHHKGNFYVRINDKGRNFRLVRVPVSSPDLAKATEVIAHRIDALLEGHDLFTNHLIVAERSNGLRQLRVTNLAKNESHSIDAPEPAYVFGLDQNPEFNTSTLRFTYTSLVTPGSVYDYDMEKRARTLKKQQPVLGGYDPKLYTAERVFATASDGTKIPVALVYKTSLFKKDGSNPTLLYGYGSYGINSDPFFSSDRLSLLDRGFIWAIASIRGGSEMGKAWHDNGRMLNKRNSFTDFIAAGEFLVKNKYTRPAKLGILGGSAGGLLMGAVVNMRPDLFGAVIAKVPFVDVVSTMQDKSLPLTVGEFEEWGNPEDAKYYGYIRSYSPYDNVERQTFPHMLVTGGLNDPRVSYWEPAKWVAKLRTMKKGDNMLIMKMNMAAGHGGASGRYERYKETALDYAFLITALGVEKP
ncbi:MAG: S9 family peptidase [Bryobacteraceae bacterium]|nr:S9 family peptidase [Bryobacteraceae bacterium]